MKTYLNHPTLSHEGPLRRGVINDEIPDPGPRNSRNGTVLKRK